MMIIPFYCQDYPEDYDPDDEPLGVSESARDANVESPFADSQGAACNRSVREGEGREENPNE